MNRLKFYLALTLVAITCGLSCQCPASEAGTGKGDFAQLSLSTDLRPNTTNPVKVILDTNDGSQGITNNKGDITIGSDGLYLIFAAPQVGRLSGYKPGWVTCWLKLNGKDVTNSNVLLNLVNNQKDVIISQGAMRLNAGDKLNVMMGIERTGEGLGLEAIKPDNQPLVPGIIFTIVKIAD